MPTQIQNYQINEPSLSGYIQEVASSPNVGANYYPSNGNPSGYVMTGQTGQFQPAGSYVLTSQTGQFYNTNNVSGFITSGQTGQFYSITNPNAYCTSGNLTGASGFLQTQINANISGISNLLSITGNFYQNSNPSGFVPSGNFIGIGGIFITGDGTNVIISGSGGGIGTSGNLITITGSTAQSGTYNLTGIGGAQVILSGNTILVSGGSSNAATGNTITITGSSIRTGNYNLSGIGSTNIFTSGNNIIISGINNSGNTVTVTGSSTQTGNYNFIGTGSVNVSLSGNTILVSGIQNTLFGILAPSGMTVNFDLSKGNYFSLINDVQSGTGQINFLNAQPGSNCIIEVDNVGFNLPIAMGNTFGIQAGGGGYIYNPAPSGSRTDLIAIAWKDATNLRFAVTTGYA